MLAKALHKYAKIAPRKARLVIDLIRGKSVEEALAVLPGINRKASELIEDIIRSAVNNVKVKYPEESYPDDALYISKITADGGPSLVRFRAASMGRASMIKKRSSHILVELDVIKERMDAIKAEKEKSGGKKVSSKKPASVMKQKKEAVVKGSK